MGETSGLINDAIRSFMASFDLSIFNFFGSVMQLIFDIANISTFKSVNFFYKGLTERIYAVLAIYMLFKVGISLMTYMINPDTMTDKERGVGKLIVRAMITIIMLISFPTAMNTLNRLQQPILETLPRIILGVERVNDNNVSKQGDMVAWTVYKGIVFSPKSIPSDVTDRYNYLEDGHNITTIEEAVAHVNDTGNDGEYLFNYNSGIGFGVGIFITFIMIGYCIDVSVRVFKLIILRAIAPIPIVSYLDPKSSKDGAFNKWLKTLLSVWVDIFIKLSVIYFIVFAIQELIQHRVLEYAAIELFNGTGYDSTRFSFVLFAMVIGLFFFAKDAPKFICEALGIKTKENGKLFGGIGRILAAGTIGVGAVGGAVSGFSSTLSAGGVGAGNVAKSLLAGVAGGVGGATNAGKAFFTSKDPKASEIMGQVRKYNDRLYSNAADDSTFFGRMIAGFQGNVGLRNEYQQIEEKIKDYQAAEKAMSRISKAFDGNGDYKFHYGGQSIFDSYGNEVIKAGENYSLKQINDIYNRVSATGDSAVMEKIDTVLKKQQNERLREIRMAGREQVVQNIRNGVAGWSTNDLVVFESIKTMHDVAQKYSEEPEFSHLANKRLDDPTLEWGKDYKRDIGAGAKIADQLQNSSVRARAAANAKRAEQKQNNS